jgi:hypothetical protein
MSPSPLFGGPYGYRLYPAILPGAEEEANMKRIITAFSLSVFLAVVPANAQKPDGSADETRTPREIVDALRRNLGAPETPAGSELDQLIAAASVHPLGSRDNPVRADSPVGQHRYLDRLRCENGSAPTYSRAGNFGLGVFGTIIDGYSVECEGSAPASTTIYMDMYHEGYSEPDAVPGYTITG